MSLIESLLQNKSMGNEERADLLERKYGFLKNMKGVDSSMLEDIVA